MSAAALESLPEIGTSIRSLIAQNIALLEQGLRVIDPLSDRAYESIGAHVRHSLDIYSGILRGVRTGLVDHASRARDPHVERSRARALVVIRETIARLRFISADAEDPLLVRLDHDSPLCCDRARSAPSRY